MTITPLITYRGKSCAKHLGHYVHPKNKHQFPNIASTNMPITQYSSWSLSLDSTGDATLYIFTNLTTQVRALKFHNPQQKAHILGHSPPPACIVFQKLVHEWINMDTPYTIPRFYLRALGHKWINMDDPPLQYRLLLEIPGV